MKTKRPLLATAGALVVGLVAALLLLLPPGGESQASGAALLVLQGGKGAALDVLDRTSYREEVSHVSSQEAVARAASGEAEILIFDRAAASALSDADLRALVATGTPLVLLDTKLSDSLAKLGPLTELGVKEHHARQMLDESTSYYLAQRGFSADYSAVPHYTFLWITRSADGTHTCIGIFENGIARDLEFTSFLRVASHRACGTAPQAGAVARSHR